MDNLIHPDMVKAMEDQINPTLPDYWKPAKNTASNFYRKFIKPNKMVFFIIIGIIVAIIIHGYYTKMDQEKKRVMQEYNQTSKVEENPINKIIESYKKEKSKMFNPVIKH